MDSLNDHFISAPLATLLTIISGFSIAVVSSHVGNRIFRSRDPVMQAMYFFVGLLALGWCVWLAGLLNLADKLLFKVLLRSVWIYAGFIMFARREHFCDMLMTNFRSYFQKPFFIPALVAFVLISYILLSLAVPTDADSLSYHLALPVEILNKGSLWFSKDNLHFRMAGFGEMLNLVGVANGCPQLGAFIQMIALLQVLYAVVKTAEPGFKLTTVCMVLSIPALLFLVPGQKHQLTGILATTLCFVRLFRSEPLTRSQLILWILVLMFAAGIKYSFLLSAVVLSLLFVFKCKTSSEVFRFSLMLVCLGGLVLGPELLFRWYHFGDPLSPLLERFTTSQEPVILKLGAYIKNYHESPYKFPLNLIFPKSVGGVSTIIGLSAFVLFGVFFLFKSYKTEVTCILFLVILILAFGQATSRFLMEPVLWSVPLFIRGFHSYRWLRYFAVLSKLSLFLLIPFLLFGLYSLGPSLLSDKQREEVLMHSANGYAESRWLNEVLPPDAKIAVLIKSRAFLPRPYLPWEYLSFTTLKNEKEVAVLDQKMKDYAINYLVLPYQSMDEIKERYGAEIVYGPKKIKLATRNPFIRTEHVIAVYKVTDR